MVWPKYGKNGELEHIYMVVLNGDYKNISTEFRKDQKSIFLNDTLIIKRKSQTPQKRRKIRIKEGNKNKNKNKNKKTRDKEIKVRNAKNNEYNNDSIQRYDVALIKQSCTRN